MSERIFVFGSSGHAKVVIDIIEKIGLFEIAFLVDDDLSRKGEELSGYRVIGGKTEALDAARLSSIRYGIVAVGSNSARARIADWLVSNGFHLATVIHPSAQIARGVDVLPGSALMAGVVVNSDTLIGENVIVNTGASVDHDCVVAKDVHIAPGATLCGGVTIGSGTLVGAGATIAPNLTIGNDVVIGAGATVVSDIPDFVTVVGTPARPLSQRKVTNI